MDAARVEAEYVHRVYDDIAPHFSDTRYKVRRPRRRPRRRRERDRAHSRPALPVFLSSPVALSFFLVRFTGVFPPQPWPVVDAYLRALPDGALVADVGCGNGKYLGVNRGIIAIGCDRCGNPRACARCSTFPSENAEADKRERVVYCGRARSRNLAAIAGGRGFHVLQCDNLALPFRTGAFVRAHFGAHGASTGRRGGGGMDGR